MKEAPLFIHHGFNIGSWYMPPFVIYTWIVMGLLILMALAVRSSLKPIPGGLQNVVEAFIGGLRDFTVNTMGPQGLNYFPLIGTAAFFILLCNLIGIVPGFESPTSNLNTTGACAVTVVVTTHIVGVQKHGLKYIKHFLGPVWWLAPLMFFIEVIGHIARLLSLSLRLFGNIRGEDLLLVLLLTLVPFLIPGIMVVHLLQTFTSFVQTFVFVLLTMLYISGAAEHAH